MRERSVSRRVARAVGWILIATATLHLFVSLTMIERETLTMREGILTFGLRMLRVSAKAGMLEPETLVRELGQRPGLTVVAYDESGKLVTRSRADVPVQTQLDPAQMDGAKRAPDDAFFLESYSFGRDNVGVIRVGERGVGYVGIVDRWATRRVNRAVLIGWLGGIAAAVLVGFVATRMLGRRMRRQIERAEVVVDRIARGSLAERLPDLGDDELGGLARSFNHMADQLSNRVDDLVRERELRRRAFADWSHELATPLSSVLGYLESLKLGTVDSGSRERYVGTAYQQALALKALCDDLSMLAQIEFDGLAVDGALFDLAEIAHDEASALESVAREKGVELVLDAEPAPAVGDRQRMARVLRNLLTNAIRHTPSGKRVRVSTRADPTLLQVQDEGTGMSPLDVARVGEPFFRADASRDRRSGGRGLGLAIAKGIVEAHGGTLTIESSPEAGTRASVSLPAVG